jgi:ABC-type branched-subunit amino acid transport system substrate-binding protein
MAYLGDFYSSQVEASAPILAAAGLLQVAPVATYAELGSSTLVRLMPHDGVGARVIADWLAESGVTELLVVHDHGPVPVGAMCVEAANARGIAVRSRPVWNHAERAADDLGNAQAVLFEAMALILDAIAAGGADRDAVVRAARGTTDRDSILGRYSLDDDGHTTTTAYGCLGHRERRARQRLSTSRSVLPPTRASGSKPRRSAPGLSASRP